MQGEGDGIRVSMAGPTVALTALSPPQMDPCNSPPTAYTFGELKSETSLDTPEATADACVLARLNGLKGCSANLLHIQTPWKASTF